MIRRVLAILALAAAASVALVAPASAANYTPKPPIVAAGSTSPSNPAPGQPVTFSGAGFAPGSTVTVAVNGRTFAKVKASADGAFSVTFTPRRPGALVFTARGVDATGRARLVRATVVVRGAAAGTAGTTSSANGGLPRTGATVAPQLWMGVGLLAVGAGLVSLTVARRRESVLAPR